MARVTAFAGVLPILLVTKLKNECLGYVNVARVEKAGGCVAHDALSMRKMCGVDEFEIRGSTTIFPRSLREVQTRRGPGPCSVDFLQKTRCIVGGDLRPACPCA